MSAIENTNPIDLTSLAIKGALPAGLVVNADGSFTYTPDENYHGSDSFQYAVSNGHDGLTHYWSLAGHANDSVGANHGSVTGTTVATGQFGDALAFDETELSAIVSRFEAWFDATRDRLEETPETVDAVGWTAARQENEQLWRSLTRFSKSRAGGVRNRLADIKRDSSSLVERLRRRWWR